jgi:hypothetical protein
MKDRLEAMIAARSIIRLVFRSQRLQHSSLKRLSSGHGGRHRQYIAALLYFEIYISRGYHLPREYVKGELMLILMILLIAAALIALFSYPAGRQCPKGCHGCGKCMNGNPDKQGQGKV